MALLFADSFDNYAEESSAALSEAGWIIETSFVVAKQQSGFSGHARSGPKFAHMQASGYKVRAIPLNTGTVIFGVAVYVPSLTAGGHNWRMVFYDENFGAQCVVGIDTDGSIDLYRGFFTTLIAGTAAGKFVAGQWNYLEFKVVISDTGSYELRLNGTTELSGSADTRGTSLVGATYVGFQSAGSGSHGDTARLDDAYCCDGTGSINNDFLGQVRCFYQTPSTDVTLTNVQGVPRDASGLRRLNVDELTPDDIGYIKSTATTALYGFSAKALPGFVTAIKGGIVEARFSRIGDGTNNARARAKSGTTTGNGATVRPPPFFANHKEVFQVDPNTSALWTVANFNAAEWQMERTA